MVTIPHFSLYTSFSLFVVYNFGGIFLSVGEVYFPSSWIWADLLTCIDIDSAVEFGRSDGVPVLRPPEAWQPLYSLEPFAVTKLG